MQYVATGQIAHVSERTSFNKRGEEQITVVVTQSNELIPKRLEYLQFEFMGELMDKVEDLGFRNGDLVQVTFQICGRCFAKEGLPEKYFQNLQGLSISYL
jgi:hypothetical protein